MDERFVDALWKITREHPTLVADMARFGGSVNVNKIDVAVSQLNTAVWLWFKDADIASIHTLTGAAFGILADLYHHKTKKHPTPFDEVHVHEELRGYMRELRNLMKGAQDFLKHARHDRDSIYPINPVWTAHYIFNAIKAYTELNGGKCDQPLMSLFVIRFRQLFPEIFGDAAPPGPDEGGHIEAPNSARSGNVEFFNRVCVGTLRDWPPPGHPGR